MSFSFRTGETVTHGSKIPNTPRIGSLVIEHSQARSQMLN